MALNEVRRRDAKTPQETTEKFVLEDQVLLFQYLISDVDAFALARDIVKPEYFESRLRGAVRHTLEYADANGAIPPIEHIVAKTSVPIKKSTEISSGHLTWFLKEVEDFCRYKAVEQTALDALGLIQTGQYGEYERRIREAVTVGLVKNLGTDYFKDPAERLKKMLDKSGYVSTGWLTLDKKLHGGFQKGTLNIFAGASGSGKSLFLQNLAQNWSDAGLYVIYFSLELYEPDVALRLDAMLTGQSTMEVVRNIESTALQIEDHANHKGGGLLIKKLSSPSTNGLKAFVKEYEIKTGRKPDAILVDYLDLMHPNNDTVDLTNSFAKDKFVSEELRNMAGDLDCLLATASQLNRQSHEAANDGKQYGQNHIAGGISKINTADNVFALSMDAQMKLDGIANLLFLKCRNANATGQSLTLKYNADTMRIIDKPFDEHEDTEKPLSKDQVKQVLSKNRFGSSTAAPQTSTIPPEKKAKIFELMNSNKSSDDL